MLNKWIQCLLLMTIPHCPPSFERDEILLHDLLSFHVQGVVLALFPAVHVHVASLAGLAPWQPNTNTNKKHNLCTTTNETERQSGHSKKGDLGQTKNLLEGGSKFFLYIHAVSASLKTQLCLCPHGVLAHFFVVYLHGSEMMLGRRSRRELSNFVTNDQVMFKAILKDSDIESHLLKM